MLIFMLCRIVAKSISKERGNMKLVLSSFKLEAGGWSVSLLETQRHDVINNIPSMWFSPYATLLRQQDQEDNPMMD